MNSKPTPLVQALLLADQIYTDELTKKRIIAGTFSRVFSKQVPVVFAARPWAYLLLTDVYDEAVIELRFVRVRDNSILLQSPALRVPAQGPLKPIEIAIQLPALLLPEEGTYTVECWSGNEMIGSSRILVELLREGDDDN